MCMYLLIGHHRNTIKDHKSEIEIMVILETTSNNNNNSNNKTHLKGKSNI